MVAEREPTATAGILDRQSVKTTEVGGVGGDDGGNAGVGRQRQLVVDTDGMIEALDVQPADGADAIGGRAGLSAAVAADPTLALVWADHADRGLAEWAQQTLGLTLEIVETGKGQGLVVAPQRWIVERTFAWLDKCRLLRRDHEDDAASTKTWIYLAMTRLMVRRMAHVFL